MQHCKGKRTPSVILQQMMSNKSDDSITTNSQYETQVPWLLLNLLSSHCSGSKLQSPHEAFGASSTLSIHFLQHSMPVSEQAHTHTHTHTHISTALRQQPNSSCLPHINSYTRMFVLDLTRTKNICIFADKICYKKARKTTRRGRVA